MATTFMEMVEAAKAETKAVTPQVMQNSDALIIDVRDASDIAATGIVPGAVPISLGTLGYKADVTLPQEMQHPELGDHDREIIVTCKVGAMASLGAKQLQDMGYKNVSYVDGGTMAHIEAGLPVEAFKA